MLSSRNEGDIAMNDPDIKQVVREKYGEAA
ncbi:MAG: hypothetical protein H6R27_866, partial [Proteobacteria bacterium]|nr:hypothetical protein [Pseudomonadota bacterium]